MAKKPTKKVSITKPKATRATAVKTVATKPVKKVVSSQAVATKVTAVTTPAAESGLGAYVKRQFRQPLSVGALLSELVGTFVLALMWLNLQGNALYIFFGLIGLVFAYSAISGAHLNPIVTLGLWAARQIQGLKAVLFVVAQFLGAMLATVVATAFVPQGLDQSTGQTHQLFQTAGLPTATDQLWRLLAGEGLSAFVFAFTVAAAFVIPRTPLGRALGYAGAFLLGVFVVSSQAVVFNPALALSLGALEWSWWAFGIYVFTPLVAGIIGFNLFRFLQREASRVDVRATLTDQL